MTRVAHVDLLIPSLLAHRFLPPEWVEAGNGDIEVGQGHRDARVAHVLRQVGSGRKRHSDAGERGAPAHGGGTRTLRQRLRVVERGEVVALIARRGEVDARRKRAVRVRLGVLAVAPLHLETLLLGEVGHTLLARSGVLVAEEEAARVSVALAVVARRRDSPGALGVDLPQELQVPLVAHGEVVAAVTQIEAAGVLVTIGGHDESAAVTLGEGEEAVGDGEGHRHVGNDEVGGTEHHVLARAHLGTREREIEVGVRVVAGGVSSVLQVDHSRGVALRPRAGEESVLLRRVHVVDERLLALEIELDGVGVVGVASHLEDGLSLDTVLGGGVGGTHGRDIALVHIHSDAVGGEVHVLVLHVGVAVEMRHLVMGVVDQGVGGGVVDRCVHSTRLLPLDAVEADAVVDDLVVLPDSLLQGVHPHGVALLHADFVAESIDEYGVAHRHGSGVAGSLLLAFLLCRHTRTCHHHRRDGGKQHKGYG